MAKGAGVDPEGQGAGGDPAEEGGGVRVTNTRRMDSDDEKD